MKKYIYEKGSMHENKFRLEELPPPPYYEVAQFKEDDFIKKPLKTVCTELKEFRYRHGYVVFALDFNLNAIKIGGNYDSGD